MVAFESGHQRANDQTQQYQIRCQELPPVLGQEPDARNQRSRSMGTGGLWGRAHHSGGSEQAGAKQRDKSLSDPSREKGRPYCGTIGSERAIDHAALSQCSLSPSHEAHPANTGRVDRRMQKDDGMF